MKRVALNEGHEHVRNEIDNIRNQNSQMQLVGETSQLQLNSSIHRWAWSL